MSPARARTRTKMYHLVIGSKSMYLIDSVGLMSLCCNDDDDDDRIDDDDDDDDDNDI